MQVTQCALDFIEKIHQKLLDRGKGIRATWIIHGAVPMISLHWGSNKPASAMRNKVRIVKTDEALAFWRVQGQGVRQTMRHADRRFDAPDFKLEEVPTLQDVTSAVVAEQQFKLIFGQSIISHEDSIAP